MISSLNASFCTGNFKRFVFVPDRLFIYFFFFEGGCYDIVCTNYSISRAQIIMIFTYPLACIWLSMIVADCIVYDYESARLLHIERKLVVLLSVVHFD